MIELSTPSITRPTGKACYGHIKHLPGSRLGHKDSFCSLGEAIVATEKVWDNDDLVIVREKVDGCNVAVTKLNGEIVALSRGGYLCTQSEYEQLRSFARWVRARVWHFDAWLADGETIHGEWLAQACSTRYDFSQAQYACPFVPFDWSDSSGNKLCYFDFKYRVHGLLEDEGLCPAALLHIGGAVKPEVAMARWDAKLRGNIDPGEGAVWRVERFDHELDKYRLSFQTKWVRSDYLPGQFLKLDKPYWNFVC